MDEFLSNKELTQEEKGILTAAAPGGEKLLFVIVGDISAHAEYAMSILGATAKHLFTYDFAENRVVDTVAIADITSIRCKRMYGNGLLRVETGEGEPCEKKDLFRFTFAVAALCDATVNFVNDLNAGAPLDDTVASMEATYTKLLSVCPKCGRTLSSPGAQCLNCSSKSHVIRQLWIYLKPEMPQLIASVIMSTITTALALLPPYLTKTLVDDILPNKLERDLFMISMFLIGIYVVRYAISGVRGYILRVSGDRIVARLRDDVYEKAQYLPMRFYDKTSTGAVINRISGDCNTLQSFMLRVTQEVLVEFFKLIGIIVIMLMMNWKLTLYSLFPVPIVVIGSRIFRIKIAPFYRRIWRRWSAVSSVLTDSLPGIRVVKSFTNEKSATKRFSEVVDEWFVTDSKAGKILNAYPAIVNCFISLGTVVIWSFGGRLIIGGGDASGLTVGLLVSFISYASMFYEPVNFFANFSDSFQSALASAERIMDIIDAEPEHDFGKGNTNADMGGRIVFKNVNFSFDRTKKVLNNINLTIEPGDIVGIVGTTGSGKSTLINLLLRYYDHYEGKITVGGVDIRKIDMEYYRSQIGYVQQEPTMFHDTIFNNIAYGDKHQFTVDQVIHAADIANAHEFIIRQPNGYDCVLGERGVGLSGGERQRISIARAVLRNPKMLVFDEATASVDSETEHLIQDAIERLISGRTTIMIAHRLSTLSKANKIVVVDNGSIIECGTPDELLEKKGKYYKLVQIQSMADKLSAQKREEKFED